MTDQQPTVAIIDYGLGNLFSVAQACTWAGLAPTITSHRDTVLQADAVILPGVGAFSGAMSALRRLDLVAPLRDLAQAGRPLMGVCLGFQLLMTESAEFGQHRGLGILPGEVSRLPDQRASRCKVPHVGWGRIRRVASPSLWQQSALAETEDGAYMYFVHSYFVKPASPGIVLTATQYGDAEFCSSVQAGNIFASQFHPERSGPGGLTIYRRLRVQLQESVGGL